MAVVPTKNGLVANVVVERYVRSTNVRTVAKVRCWSAVTNVAACASNTATASAQVRSMVAAAAAAATGTVGSVGPYIVVVVLELVGPCQTFHAATAAVQYPGNVPAHQAVSVHRAASSTVGNVHVSVHHCAPKGPWGRAIHQMPPTRAPHHTGVFHRGGATP